MKRPFFELFGVASLVGLAVPATILSAMWFPTVGALQQAQQNERQRILQCFMDPLAKALASGDDLARVDELKRLNALPGVSHVRLETGEGKPPRGAVALIWEGRHVGQLGFRLTSGLAKKSIYHWLERAFSVSLLCVVFAMAAAAVVGRRMHSHRRRVVSALGRLRRRRRSVAKERLASAAIDRDGWLRQFVVSLPQGTAVLDHEQRLVAFNAAAAAVFDLSDAALGRNWLDVVRSAAWAGALGRSLERPGDPQPVTPERISPSVRTSRSHSPQGTLTWITLPETDIIPACSLSLASV
jgi:PAS domain-containing protein